MRMNSKVTKISLLLLVCLVTFSYLIVAFDDGWEELKGDHFLIYYTRGKKFAKTTLDKAEDYYKKIADDLGYARHSDFWSWDNRVKIYIYPSSKAYLSYVKSMGYAEWSVGFADYSKKEIVGYHQSRQFLDTTLPHELTHLMFRDYVGRRNIPMWIDEGVAQWHEKGKRNIVNKRLREVLKHHSSISMDRMMSINIGAADNEFIVDLYYLQAVSIIDFMVSRYGSDKFIYFCRQLRDGKDTDDALKFVYPTSLRSAEDLEREWLKYLQVD
jgi:hypothetical protein